MGKSKKILTLGVAAILLLQLVGCGKEKEAASTDSAEDEFVYVAEYQSLQTDGYSMSNAVFGKDDNIFFVGNNESGSKLFSLKIGEKELKGMPSELEEDVMVSGIGNDAEGNLLLGLVKYKKAGETGTEGGGSQIEQVEIRKLSASGDVLASVDATDAFGKIPDFYIQSMLEVKDGNYYVCVNQSVFVLKPDGELLCEIPAEAYISNMFSVGNEKVLIAYYGDVGWNVKEVDAAQKGLSEVGSSIAFDYGTYQGGTDTDLIYTQGTMLYTCNLKDEKPTEILNWVDSDIDSNNLRSFRILEDGRIAAFSVDYSSENVESELALLTKKNRSEVPEKKILTYGTLYLPYFANKDIVAFNKQSDEYRIEVKLYGDDNTDYETKVSLFNADISGGEGPDIIDFPYNPLSLEEYISSGILEDLTPYLEKDAELKREDFLDNVFKAYEKDGKLYAVMPAFGVDTIIGKISDVGEEKTWTIDDMMELMDSKPQDAEILPYSSKTSILHLLCNLNMDVFVNKETGECDFSGDEFKKILEFANRFPNEINDDPNGPSEIERIRNEQLILLNRSVTSVALYQMYEYEFGGPVNFIGYPTTTESGSIITPFGTTAGMNVNSKNKDGVWEFLRFNLTEERQESVTYASGAFPSRKSSLEKQFAKDMEKEYYEDADGSQKESAKATWGSGDFSVEVFAATKEQVDSVREMIETARSGEQIDGKMFGIINEEAQAYFEEQKSAEDVSELIQNRIQTYVNETR